MKENKKKSLILIAFALIMIIAGCLLIFFKKDNNKTNNEKADQDKELGITEEIVKEYVSYIPLINNTELYLFQDKEIIVTEVPMKLLLGTAYLNLKDDEVTGSGNMGLTKEKCDDNEGVYFLNYCYLEGNISTKNYYFMKDSFVRKVENMYGNNITVEAQERIDGKDNCSCDLNNDYYYCRCGNSFTDIGYSESFVELDHFEQKNDELYVYVKHLFGSYADVDSSGNELANVYDKKDGKLLGEAHSLSNEIVFGNYRDKASIYKNTFKKNPDGTYYWYSIEPVKEESEIE